METTYGTTGDDKNYTIFYSVVQNTLEPFDAKPLRDKLQKVLHFNDTTLVIRLLIKTENLNSFNFGEINKL